MNFTLECPLTCYSFQRLSEHQSLGGETVTLYPTVTFQPVNLYFKNPNSLVVYEIQGLFEVVTNKKCSMIECKIRRYVKH